MHSSGVGIRQWAGPLSLRAHSQYAALAAADEYFFWSDLKKSWMALIAKFPKEDRFSLTRLYDYPVRTHVSCART